MQLQVLGPLSQTTRHHSGHVGALPLCTTRCGLFAKDNTWSPEQACALQDYMVAVNAIATNAYDGYRKGNDIVDDDKFQPPQPDKSIVFRLAIPPLKKKKTKAKATDTNAAAKFEKSATWACLPPPLKHVPAKHCRTTYICTDGSFTQKKDQDNQCGWGFCVVPWLEGLVIDMCGPVDFDGPLADIQCAQTLSNSVGELCAVLHALCWASHQGPFLQSITIAYDSDCHEDHQEDSKASHQY